MTIIEGSGQAWKVTIAMIVSAAPIVGMVVRADVWLLSLMALSPMALAAFGWTAFSIRCPRCHDTWLWRAASTGSRPTLRGSLTAQSCPVCGLTAEAMIAQRRTR
jgi:hypothetical protein